MTGARRLLLSTLLSVLIALTAPSLQWALAETSAAVDPVGKLREISESVGKSAKELETVATDLDKLSAELDALEKLPPGPKSRQKVQELEGRFKATVKRSEETEKKACASLDDNEKEIKSLRRTITAIESDHKAGKGAKSMTDEDIKECLKDLDDVEATLKELRRALDDSPVNEAKPAGKSTTDNRSKKNNSKKNNSQKE